MLARGKESGNDPRMQIKDSANRSPRPKASRTVRRSEAKVAPDPDFSRWRREQSAALAEMAAALLRD